MLKLCGFSVSNYYNKVKIALLEKNIPFEEQFVSTKDADTNSSPIGKIPYLLTDQGPMSESNVIMEYLEELSQQPTLLPGDHYQRAKVRELTIFIELYLELEARKIYPEAFFGAKVSDQTKLSVKTNLEKNLQGLTRLTRFSPYLAGDSFTFADCSAAVHFPILSSASKIIFGEDLLEKYIPMESYLQVLKMHTSVNKVNQDRKEALKQMATVVGR
ncbi:MAG: glutathione S-transferase [Gammaproteobacteria bacterium]|nr:glutathione S-transferase [Gammaproteobacteria bacterium]